MGARLLLHLHLPRPSRAVLPQRNGNAHIPYVLCRCHSLRVALAGRSLPACADTVHLCMGQQPTAARGVEPPGCQVGLALVADDVGAARLVHRAEQPLASIAASRYALRPCACGSLVATRLPPRATRSAPKAWGAYMCCSPDNLHALPLGGRDVEGVERFALLETLGAMRASRSCRERGLGRGSADIIMRERAGNACVLTQHVQ